MQPNFRAIFTDIDGTLITTDHIITEKTRNAIRTCLDQGITVALCSSRCPAGLRPIMKKYDLPCCMVSLGGALVVDQDGNILHEQGMPLETARQVVQFVEEKGFDLTWSIYTTHKWLTKDTSDPRIVHEENVIEAKAEYGTPDTLPADTQILKILCTCDPAITADVQAQLQAAFPALTMAQSSPKLIEITAPGVDKGMAVRVFCEKKGIELCETLGFGDNYNDLAMLEAVGCSVLMQNAPAALHGKFSMMTDDNDHDGIAKALEELHMI